MIFRDKVDYKTNFWSNILKGRHPVFVLGNGPSIAKQNLSLLNNYFTIGINRIYFLFDPIILLWQDKEIYRDDGFNKIIHSSSVKYCSQQANCERLFESFKLKKDFYKFHMNPKILYGTGCSGGLGCQLAYAMGASSIILLGTDCCYNKKGMTNFYGKNQDHKHHTLKNFEKAMRWVKKESPIPVFNCSDTTFWEKMSLEQAINESKPTSLSKLEWHYLLSSHSKHREEEI